MRSNLALTVIFVILTGLSAWKLVGTATEYMDLETSPTLFDGFLPETVATISVVRAKRDGSKDPQGNPALERLIFHKQEGDWIIADQESAFLGVSVMSSQIVSDILERVGRIKVTDSNVINTKADDLELAETEVDDKASMRIQCLDANQQILTDLYVGRSAGKDVEGTNEAVDGTFVRREGTKQIVLFDEAFPMDMDAKSWIDKTRRDISPDQVTEIEIEGKAEGKNIAVHFKRDGNKGWKAVQPPADVGTLKEYSITEIIQAACRVDAIDIIARLNPAVLQQYGLAPKARLHVIIKTKDDKTLDLFVGKRVEGKQDYYAYIGGSLLFSLAEWDVSRYEKEAKEFFDPKPTEIKKPGDKPGDKPGEKSGDKSGDKPGKIPGEQPGDTKKQDPKESGEAGSSSKGDDGKGASQEKPKEEPKEEPGKGGSGQEPEAKPASEVPANKEAAGKAPVPASQPSKKD